MPKIEFIEESHQYLIDGKEVPSVTQIVKWKFPKTYEGIPEDVLKKASEYGTEVHKQVEDALISKELPKIKNNDILKSVVDARTLMKSYCMYPNEMEQMCQYKKKYAGTFDIKTQDDCLIDIKTTSKIHIDNETLQAPLNLQMSLYKLALGYTNVSTCWCLWLPKRGKSKICEVKTWEEEDLIKLLKEWKNDQI